MSDKMKKLLKTLEDVRTEMETMLEDETILTFPKAFRRMKDNFDDVIVAVEAGDYNEEKEEDDEEEGEGEINNG